MPLWTPPQLGESCERFNACCRLNSCDYCLCDSPCDCRQVVHEVGHVLGMFHTQQRPDALTFITNRARLACKSVFVACLMCGGLIVHTQLSTEAPAWRMARPPTFAARR